MAVLKLLEAAFLLAVLGGTGAASTGSSWPRDADTKLDTERWLAEHTWPSSHDLQAAPPPTSLGRIPRLIHQTADVEGNSFRTAEAQRWRRSWEELNPGWSIVFYNDTGALNFMREHAPEYAEVYEALPHRVLRADLFRYSVLLKRGGLYTDMDTECVVPIDEALGLGGDPDEVGLVVGLESVIDSDEEMRERAYVRHEQILQWTIASEPGHPALRQLCDDIVEAAAEMSAQVESTLEDPTTSDFIEAVLDFTGPGRFSDAVHHHLEETTLASAEQLPSDGLVPPAAGKVRILPKSAWGTLPWDDHTDAAVLHHFEGSWKRRSLARNNETSAAPPPPPPRAEPSPPPPRDEDKLVEITLTLMGITKDEFVGEVEEAYIDGLAAFLGVRSRNIDVLSVRSIRARRRRLLQKQNGIEVETQVEARNRNEIDRIFDELVADDGSLEKSLHDEGFPKSASLTDVEVAKPPVEDEDYDYDYDEGDDEGAAHAVSSLAGCFTLAATALAIALGA